MRNYSSDSPQLPCGSHCQTAAIWLLIFTSAATSATRSIANDQPNIIVIVSDDAGYNEFGFANALTGYPTTHAVTPNLDALASQSIVARQGYVASPLCHPSRVGLLTGQYPQRFGREDNLPNDINNRFGLHSNDDLLPHYLKDLGYTTGAIGKWHLGFQDGVNRPLDQGFDEFYGFLSGSRNYYVDTQPANRMRRGNTDIEGFWRSQGNASEYDPVRGRYVTDAFGEEAVDFINRHADDVDPFFLYVAFTAPHTPWAVKQADYDKLSHITDSRERESAAMILAMDRAVGGMMDALDAHGLDDNTIVVFMNDNGGPTFSGHYNQPFRGFKGYTFEGGIRVPFTIKMPGLQAGTYDAPINAVDLLPTLVAAAGGDPSQLTTDGVDLTPHLSGENSNRPHELMFWRNRTFWAVRKGDWKLCRPNEPQFNFYALYDLENDPLEVTNQLNSRPDIAADLRREFTYWEATLKKPESANLGSDNRNRFDHFVFRNDQGPSTQWGAAGAWRQAGTANAKTMLMDDAYANAILEFTTQSDNDYIATNNMMRMSGLTFMLNQLRFTGQFDGSSDRAGTVDGNALLLFKNLAGEQPRIQLDATSSTSSRFLFQIGNQLELLDDLEIAGDGTQAFAITGRIIDYFEPRGVTKWGTSNVTLSGNNTFRGSLTIEGGTIRVAGSNAAINGAASIVIGSGGDLILDSGTISVAAIDNDSGGTFEFNGGRLSVAQVFGDLVNSGGILAPGDAMGLSAVSGDFVQNSGTLELEIGGVANAWIDRVQIDGDAVLGGTLQVLLANGFVPSAGNLFEIIGAAGGITEEFDTYLVPTLPQNLGWNIYYGTNSVQLWVASGLEGDFNQDGRVDTADYVVWRKGAGSIFSQNDYNLWRTNIGGVRIHAAGVAAAVPEPSLCATACCAVAVLLGLSRRWGRCG